MKVSEIREIPLEEIDKHIAQARKELFEARIQHSMRQLENTSLFRQLRHRIAQLETVRSEKTRGSIPTAPKKGGRQK